MAAALFAGWFSEAFDESSSGRLDEMRWTISADLGFSPAIGTHTSSESGCRGQAGR